MLNNKKIINNKKLQFLYTNIGRGHPFYLDGIVDELTRTDQINLCRDITDVFTQSGFISRQIWDIARFVYRTGSSEGLLGNFYNKFRKGNDYNRPSALIKLAGRDIIRTYQNDNSSPLLVAHPILTGLFSGRDDLIYQHGELVAPDEALVTGAASILVPTEKVAQKFLSIGYTSDQVIETGLCIEPALVRQAEDCYDLRMKRLSEKRPLTFAMFSSGAEPVAHIKMLLALARSLISSGQRVILSTTTGGKFESEAKNLLTTTGCTSTIITNITEIPQELPTLSVICNSTRKIENSLIAQLYSNFDCFVAPPHERTNWAVGLGLPMFPLTPCYGSYAPLNLELLLSSKTAIPIENEEQALKFGESVARLKAEQVLVKMAEAGWGRYPINGFTKIVRWLGSKYAM